MHHTHQLLYPSLIQPSLQYKLRMLRAWQQKTLADVAMLASVEPRFAVDFETHAKHDYARHPSDVFLLRLARAYGIIPETLIHLLDQEYEYGVCADSKEYHKPLPQVAQHLFKIGGFVVIDTETTGTNPHHPDTAIVEIAILDEDGEPLVFSRVKPHVLIPQEATAIHGITNEDVADAPTFAELYPRIASAISNKIVVIYNADYDGYLLDKLLISHHLEMPPYETYCLMKAYADYYKAPGKYGNYAWQSLGKACEQQHVTLENAHNAMSDALATWHLLKTLAARRY